ncbi:MATE family efflux transporter [Microvirga sp. W0021]|uniref:Multidrug-efflux transporter n=1 Tax=Hohaiivirga grylli TaxID=3133970 RepID=A0ABV0BL55_9HYPH
MFAQQRENTGFDWSGFRKELLAMLLLSWPMIMTNLSQTALTVIDVMLTGRLGAEALAAGALATNLYFGFFIFGVGVVTVTSPIIANTLGRKRNDVREVRRIFRQGLWAAACLSVPVWIVLWHAEEILIYIGQKPELAAEAGHYMHVLQWAYFPTLVYALVRSFVATLERPAWALFICLTALPINFLVAWALMFGNFGMPALGLPGAGYATLFASIYMAIGMLVVVLRAKKFRRYRLLGRFWRPDWPKFFAIWRLGLPAGLHMVFEVVAFTFSALMMGVLGTNELAAHTIAIQISGLCFMVPVGLGQAVAIRVGLANGAGNSHGVTLAGRAAMTMALGFALCTATVMILMPELLVSFYLDLSDPKNAAVVALATGFLFYSAVFQLSDGVQAVGVGMLRGLRDVRIPMILAGIGYCVIGLPLGITLAFNTPLRGQGIWIGFVTGLTLVAFAVVWRWSKRNQINRWVR